MGHPGLPDHALRIAQVAVSQGGLGVLAPGARAAPDFVLRMTRSMRYARHGFRAHRDLRATFVHPSIKNLFDPTYNSGSRTLQRYYCLLPYVVRVAYLPK